jgi:myo-inositol-1-phosphate synthase
MKYTVEVKDEHGKTHQFETVKSTRDEQKSLNDFILDALSISEDKRRLPFVIQCPNGVEVYPSIKMKFENHGSPILGDKLEAMAVSWRD